MNEVLSLRSTAQWADVVDILNKVDQLWINNEPILILDVDANRRVVVHYEHQNVTKTFGAHAKVTGTVTYTLPPKRQPNVLRPNKTARDAPKRARYEQNRAQRARDNRERARRAGAGQKKKG